MAFEQQEVQFQTKKVLGVSEFAVNTKLSLDLEKPLKKVLNISASAEVLSGELIDTDYSILGKTNIQLLYVTEAGELENVTATVDWQNTVKVVGENPSAYVTVKETSIEASSMAEISLSILHNCEVEGLTTSLVTPLPSITDDYVTDTNTITYNKLASSSVSKFALAETLETSSNAKSVLACDCAITSINASSNIDLVSVEGTANVKVLYLTEEGTNTLTKQIDFKQEVPCMGAMPSEEAWANLSVINAGCTLQVAEKCTFVIGVNILASVSTYKAETLSLVSDLFSLTKTLDTTTDCVEFASYNGSKNFTDNVTITSNIPGEDIVLVDAISPSVYIAKQTIENGYIVVEGVASAYVVYKAGEEVNSYTVTSPFVSRVECPLNGTIASLGACANVISCKARTAGEVDVMLELFFNVNIVEDKYFEFVKSVTETGERQNLSSAVTIYVTKEGERLFDVARALGISPDAILEQNTVLEGKFSAGQRVFVYSPLNAEF